MDAAYYHEQFAIEDSHWWYLGRRRILTRVLARFRPADNASVLEIGCGGGGNLKMLAKSAKHLAAIEMEPDAVAAAHSRGIGEVAQGKLGDDVPALAARYDMVAMFDVLEHIPDDAVALEKVRALLEPSGRVFITVPAYMLLWSEHDRIAHHHRRYTRAGLVRVLQANGFRVVYASYFNTFLFPVAALTLLFSRLFALDPKAATKQPAGFVNRVLRKIFASETAFIPRLTLPFGLSIVLVAERL